MAYHRLPAPDRCRFLERDERTAMYSRILKHRVTTFEAVQKDASGTVQGTERAFPVDLRPDFRWPQLEVAGKERDERRRSIGTERRSEEHTSELQSHLNIVCRLLLEKKKTKTITLSSTHAPDQ